MTKSKFLRIVCPKCKAEHIIFGKSSIRIKCRYCNCSLTKTNGGKTKILARIKEVLWN